ncbi:unnamed protein product [Hymenolepis diminuta]|uniref:Bestrophin homolog n=1 Tax=Hymenolepis diminuta TaxID=6216 RepID=A0A158QFZ5_HYMDI|nr:unnamed protein product [Hymenolepis diminuta]
MDATFIWKLSKLGRIGSTRQRYDDDFADRLNYQYTSVLLFLFIGLIGIRQYFCSSWHGSGGDETNEDKRPTYRYVRIRFLSFDTVKRKEQPYPLPIPFDYENTIYAT